ncbi:hypothetical protein YDYSY3_32360 [Paenibacillus chitinolyticus]|uniref:hypothetical protein n=1 Tax=Paenibacillus chitinolyticus TaxID=79263 RepID=UPI0026E4DA38|nr:hypothetical protein [Paenibacillus chitinolyticus]GKS12236.1 hypothetical protein YDYSY3_32360 [Paenibacillus chitinolyticus]
MKNISIIIALGIVLVSGCAKSPNSNQDSNANNVQPSIQANSNNNQVDGSNNTKNTNEETFGNSFFFKSGVSQLKYKGQFLFDDIVEKDVILKINVVDNLKYGKLYELKLDPIESVPNERLSLGYFYVQKDKVYKIEPTKDNLIKLKSSEEMPSGSVIVCQEQEIKDTLSKNEPGWHHYLEVNGDKREYHSFNNQVSTGYYESFIWESSKGLINYKSGYGAERDSMELQLDNNNKHGELFQ